MGMQNLLVALIVVLAALSLVRRLWSLVHGNKVETPCSACAHCSGADPSQPPCAQAAPQAGRDPVPLQSAGKIG